MQDMTMDNAVIPAFMEQWFANQRWTLRAHQRAMVAAFQKQQSTLLIAPTGGGKTLAGFLPSLIDLADGKHSGLHTLYISPLKALTHDIERNLLRPIAEMELPITVETRTGDTSSHKRKRQREKPPHILLTTPESLMLMLSYADAPRLFGNLKAVVIDEIHSFAPNKRGDFTALALARLAKLAPNHLRFGLSATVARPADLAAWLGVTGEPAARMEVPQNVKPDVRLLEVRDERIPYGGFMAKYAVSTIYRQIKQARTSIVFVNTRAQAELMFRFLWEANEAGLPIAIYHGSLSKEQRRKTERLMAEGKLRCVVATSALELGIDWGDVELVIQIGAPKGVSRLLQRIGRSNHRMDEPSQALLVPANRFEVLECTAAIRAIAEGNLDGEPLLPGSEDVLVQFIINCACSAPVTAKELHQEILNAPPYQAVDAETFAKLFRFAVDGGYVLQNYERYARLTQNEDGVYEIASRTAAQRHRQNIGVIVEAARLNVKRMNPKRGGRYIGQVEESFAQQLAPGDTFYFAGEVLEYLTVRDMNMEVRPSPASEPKIPSYAGGQMPLSTFLAEGVRDILRHPDTWQPLPEVVRDWLALQQAFSSLPQAGELLVEHFPRQKRRFTIIYTFEGRKANQTLGMLMTRRMERMRLKPLSFSVTDYALSLMGLEAITQEQLEALLSPDILIDELEEWIIESPMLKRSFRRVAMITGLTEQRYAGAHKSLRQVTFSTDLIYDVLRRHEPDHILLRVTRADAERELLDILRLGDWLRRFEGRARLQILDRPSPLSIPILVDVRREPVRGEAIDTLLEELSAQDEAEMMMNDVRNALQQ